MEGTEGLERERPSRRPRTSKPPGPGPHTARVRHWHALRFAYESFDEHDGFLLSGGIAYFAMLSLAPMLVVALGLASMLLGDEAVSGVMQRQLTPVLGARPAHFLSELVQRSGSPEAGGIAALIGSLVTFYAATRVFVELQNALHRVWEIELHGDLSLRVRAWQFVYRRIMAFLLVVLLGLLISGLLVAEGVLQWLAVEVDNIVVTRLLRTAHLGLGYAALTVLIAAIYRALTDGLVHWSNALRGAALTAFMLVAGGTLVGMYLRVGFSYTVYGAAGSFAALMLASYYGAILFVFGAELAHAYRLQMRAQ